jgi:hypothetical protein
MAGSVFGDRRPRTAVEAAELLRDRRVREHLWLAVYQRCVQHLTPTQREYVDAGRDRMLSTIDDEHTAQAQAWWREYLQAITSVGTGTGGLQPHVALETIIRCCDWSDLNTWFLLVTLVLGAPGTADELLLVTCPDLPPDRRTQYSDLVPGRGAAEMAVLLRTVLLIQRDGPVLEPLLAHGRSPHDLNLIETVLPELSVPEQEVLAALLGDRPLAAVDAIAAARQLARPTRSIPTHKPSQTASRPATQNDPRDASRGSSVVLGIPYSKRERGGRCQGAARSARSGSPPIL